MSNTLKKDGYFTKFNLISAYYHINVHPDYHKFLCFHWTFSDGKTRYFIYTVLVFGLSSASYVFTKVMRQLLTPWRLKGMKVLFYLDYGFNIASVQHLCRTNTQTMIGDIESAGYLINYEKSELTPKQIGIWLGVPINWVRTMFFVPPDKIKKLKERLTNVCTTFKAS